MPTTNATNSVFPSLVPTEVRALFGDPPLLRGEEASLYNNLMDQFSRLVEPKDMIEWWWVKDITDHTWGIRRLRRFEVLFVELRRDKVVDNRKHWNTLGENVKYVPVPAPDGKKDAGKMFLQENPDYVCQSPYPTARRTRPKCSWTWSTSTKVSTSSLHQPSCDGIAPFARLNIVASISLDGCAHRRQDRRAP